jgi:hypothetical protein
MPAVFVEQGQQASFELQRGFGRIRDAAGGEDFERLCFVRHEELQFLWLSLVLLRRVRDD